MRITAQPAPAQLSLRQLYLAHHTREIDKARAELRETHDAVRIVELNAAIDSHTAAVCRIDREAESADAKGMVTT